MSGTTKAPAGFHSELRDRVAKSFTLVEDVVYVGLGVMLAGAAVVLLVSLVVVFLRSLFGGSLPSGVIGVLDQVLLILMIVELLYTVQLSFREHVPVPEPLRARRAHRPGGGAVPKRDDRAGHLDRDDAQSRVVPRAPEKASSAGGRGAWMIARVRSSTANFTK